MKDMMSHKAKPIFSIEKTSIYKSAIELFTLSRKLTQNIHNQSTKSSKYPEERHLTEQIIQASLSLPFSIAQATVTNDYIKKVAFQHIICNHIFILKNTYNRLKNISKKNTNDIYLMEKAITRFESKFESWSTAITRQN